MSIVVKLKPLYIIAGGSDGYTYVQYTFDRERAQKEIDENTDYQGMDSGPDAIMVPETMTYADLGITYPLEDEDEDEDE
ncbi:hypothetical protein QGX12_gp074 [Pseudomonas phage Kremar]|uniref:Uncharacterized protein n=1 Tax=Pseudomonas phage Kremar TaxID=2928831 RepID=A0AAE9GV12_9CAUD|nr:hypothetical protein QGX12_gp074 [Pseudomonas phage Kremar]UOL48570.1 hypothetical protein [Pseudomonas phage Kremar]